MGFNSSRVSTLRSVIIIFSYRFLGDACLTFYFAGALLLQVLRINVHDEMELRETFFGEGDGKNYAVLCHAEDAKYPVSSVFQDASNDGSSPAEFRLLDCDHVLSSEKTVYERFNLNKKQRPVIFVSGKTGAPKQVRIQQHGIEYVLYFLLSILAT